MATIAFAIIGNAVAPGVGGFVGAVAGNLLDNLLLFPMLFPPTPIRGPRLGDRQLQLAGEGSDAKFVIGPRNPVAGTVIYCSDLIEEEDEVSSDKKGQSVTLYKYFVDIAIHVCDTEHLPDNRIHKIRTIWGDSKTILSGGHRFRCDGVTVYRGDQTTPDPLLQSILGVDNVPHYRNSCYVVIHRLALEDFGNRVPNITFEVSQTEDLDVGEGLSILLQRMGYESSEFDTSRAGGCLYGFLTAGPQTGSDNVMPLTQTYALLTREKEGQIQFITKGTEDIVTVDDGDLAARVTGSEPEDRLIAWTDVNDLSLPKEVVLKFTALDNNLQQGGVRQRRFGLDGNNTISLDFPITLDRQFASSVAMRILWEIEAGRQKAKLQLPPSYIGITEGTVLQTSQGDILLTEVNRGANFLLEAVGVRHEAAVYTQEADTQLPSGVLQAESSPPDLEVLIFDGPAIVDEVADHVGVFFAACTTKLDEEFDGAVLFSCTTKEGTYSQKKATSVESQIVDVREPPSPRADEYLWDRTTRIQVDIRYRPLVSVSEQECLDGANRLLLLDADGNAGELLGFATVSSLGGSTYELTDLLRCLKGTTPTSAATRGIVLDRTVGFLPDVTLLGSSLFWKLGPVGGNLTRITPSQVAVSGRTRRPLAPTHLRSVIGPEDRNGFREISSSSSDNSVSRVSGFPGVSPGQYVTLGGSSSSVRNRSYLVTSFVDSDTMVLDGASLGDESDLDLAMGHEKDVRISWVRRSKKNSSCFASAPVSEDENPVKYRVEIRRGGKYAAPIRSVLVSSEYFVYDYDKQVVDGTTEATKFQITVRQISAVVGDGDEAVLEVSR